MRGKKRGLGGNLPSCRNMLGVGCGISALMEGQMQSPAVIMGFKRRTVITSASGRTRLAIQTVSFGDKSSSGLHVRHSFICRVLPPCFFHFVTISSLHLRSKEGRYFISVRTGLSQICCFANTLCWSYSVVSSPSHRPYTLQASFEGFFCNS